MQISSSNVVICVNTYIYHVFCAGIYLVPVYKCVRELYIMYMYVCVHMYICTPCQRITMQSFFIDNPLSFLKYRKCTVFKHVTCALQSIVTATAVTAAESVWPSGRPSASLHTCSPLHPGLQNAFHLLWYRPPSPPQRCEPHTGPDQAEHSAGQM